MFIKIYVLGCKRIENSLRPNRATILCAYPSDNARIRLPLRVAGKCFRPLLPGHIHIFCHQLGILVKIEIHMTELRHSFEYSSGTSHSARQPGQSIEVSTPMTFSWWPATKRRHGDRSLRRVRCTTNVSCRSVWGGKPWLVTVILKRRIKTAPRPKQHWSRKCESTEIGQRIGRINPAEDTLTRRRKWNEV